MKFEEINWPVYRIGWRKPDLVDGVWMYVTTYENDEDGTLYHRYRVLDDTNIDGATLGIRRLKIKEAGGRLLPIRRATYLVADMIRVSKPTTWFVDNMGKVFQYKKERSITLECRKITKIIPNENNIGSILEVHGLTQRFKINKSNIYQGYAGLLVMGRGHMLYDLYDKPFKRTVRRV